MRSSTRGSCDSARWMSRALLLRGEALEQRGDELRPAAHGQQEALVEQRDRERLEHGPADLGRDERFARVAADPHEVAASEQLRRDDAVEHDVRFARPSSSSTP